MVGLPGGRLAWAGLWGVGFATSLLMPSTPPASAPADEFAALENMLPDFLERYSAGKVNNFLLGRCGPTIQRPLPAVPAGPDQMPWTFGGDADDAFELIRVKHYEPVVNLTGLQVNRLKACTSGQLIKLCSLAGISPMPDECISSPQLFASAIKHPRSARRKEKKEKEKRRGSVRERKQTRVSHDTHTLVGSEWAKNVVSQETFGDAVYAVYAKSIVQVLEVY